jgi:hypothetical protein
MPEWYVHDAGAETGPIGRDQAIAPLRTKDPDSVHVWREDFDDWKLLRDLPDLAAAGPPMRVAPAPAAVPGGPGRTAPAARIRGHEAVKDACKFAWAQAGALIGLAICAADLVFEWRGPKYEAFDSAAGLEHNFGQLCGTVVLAAFLGFVAGAIRDAVNIPAAAAGRTPRNSPRRRNPPPEPNPLSADIMSRHWRGELPLWFSCWVFGVIGSIVISFVPAVAIAVFTAARGYNPSSIFTVSAAVWVAVFSIAIWQAVGVWRAATRYAEAPASRHDRPGAAELVPLWSMLARLVVIVGFTSLLGTFGTEWLPQLNELYKIAFYNDPDIPAYSIQITRDGTEAEITGGFKYGLTDEFAARTKDAHRLRVVRLDSSGGRLGEGEKLFALIRERGLSTYVPSKCFSACTLAFAGGRERVLRRGAALGFHKAEFPGVSESEFDGLQHKVFSAAGFDGRFIDRALSTPHRDLWMPPPDVLLAARVITGVSDGVPVRHASASPLTAVDR